MVIAYNSITVPRTITPAVTPIYSLNKYPSYINKLPRKISNRISASDKLLSIIKSRLEDNGTLIISNWYSFYLQLRSDNKFLEKTIDIEKPYFGNKSIDINQIRILWRNSIL